MLKHCRTIWSNHVWLHEGFKEAKDLCECVCMCEAYTSLGHCHQWWLGWLSLHQRYRCLGWGSDCKRCLRRQRRSPPVDLPASQTVPWFCRRSWLNQAWWHQLGRRRLQLHGKKKQTEQCITKQVPKAAADRMQSMPALLLKMDSFLSACRASSLVKGKSNQRALVRFICMVRPNTSTYEGALSMACVPTCTRMPVITIELLLLTASTVKPPGCDGRNQVCVRQTHALTRGIFVYCFLHRLRLIMLKSWRVPTFVLATYIPVELSLCLICCPL